MKRYATALFILFIITLFTLTPSAMGTASASTEDRTFGTPDDTAGVWLFNAGSSTSNAICDGILGGENTDEVLNTATYLDVLEFIGNKEDEIIAFSAGTGSESVNPSSIDTNAADIAAGLRGLEDFGVASTSQDDVSFDAGTGGSIHIGMRAPFTVIVADGKVANGYIGPGTAETAEEAVTNLGGFEVLIVEDGELSGMTIELYSMLNTYTVELIDHQVNPNTQDGLDDTLIAIDLDSLPNWDNTYITDLRITDDGVDQGAVSTCPTSTALDTSVEINAIFTPKSVLPNIRGSIGDTVWVDANNDGVHDITEEGIGNVLVELNGTDFNGTPVTLTDITNRDGHYNFVDLLPGSYTVAIDSKTLPNNLVASYDMDGASHTPHAANVVLDPGNLDLDYDFGYLSLIPTAVTVSSVSAEQMGTTIYLVIALLLAGTTATLTRLPQRRPVRVNQ